MQRIKLLDSMRGLAAVIVVFHHLFTRLPELFNTSFPSWLLHVFEIVSDLNVQAVLFFFFLSGFSICLSLQNNLPVTPEVFNNYVYRRLKRIGPLYYFAVLFTIGTGLITRAIVVNDNYSGLNLLGNIFFLQCSKSYAGNWFAPYGENGPLWSLSFEMFYYFLLPPFLLLLMKAFNSKALSSRLSRVALVAAFIISLGCVVLNKLIFFPLIAFATLFYVWYAGFFTASLYLQKRIKINLDLLLLSSLAAILLFLNYLFTSATISKLTFGACIAIAFVVIYLLRKKVRAAFNLVIERPINFLFYKIGTGSYALYLLHFPVILLLKHFGCRSLLLALIFLGATVVSCIWLEQLFAKPKLLFLKRVYVK